MSRRQMAGLERHPTGAARVLGPIGYVSDPPGLLAPGRASWSPADGVRRAPGRRPAVFLDRDGVINQNRPDYVKVWGEFVFLPNAFEPLRSLAASTYCVVVTSNQSAVGRGLLSRAGLDDIHRSMVERIHAQGARIDAACYCPHRPWDGCECRKPLPGQLTWAARELSLDLDRSFLVGDAWTDMVAALAVGCKPVLVLTGLGRSQVQAMPANVLARCHVADDLAGAVAWILDQSNLTPPDR